MIDYNRIYLYTSKPKLIPFLKKLIPFLFVVFIIVFLILLTSFHFYLSNEDILSKARKIKLLEVFRKIVIEEIIKSLFGGIFLIYLIFIIYTATKKYKNQTEKYNPMIQYNVFIFIIFGIFIYFLYNWFTLTKYTWEYPKGTQKEGTFLELLEKYKLNFERLFKFSVGIILFLNIFFIILLIFNKPKINQIKLKKMRIEIQKSTLASLKGEKYDVDESIYD